MIYIRAVAIAATVFGLGVALGGGAHLLFNLMGVK